MAELVYALVLGTSAFGHVGSSPTIPTMKRSYLVNQKSTKMRLDIFLAKNHSAIPRRFFQNEIKNGHVLVNSKKVFPSRKLHKNDKVEFTKNFKQHKEKKVVAIPQSNIEFKIVFESKNFLIIDKPTGLSVHPSDTESSGTLANGLLYKFPQIKNIGDDPARPGIIHRLDKDTSGLIIVPLNQKSFDYFKKLFGQHQIEKKYVAVCWGLFKQKKGTVESFIGRSKTNPIKQSTSYDASKVVNPKKAVTQYEVLEEFENMSLVELVPKTGRMHQLRVHLHSIGHPVVGDKKYHTKLIKQGNFKFKRHLLHAKELQFTFNNQKYHFYSKPPQKFT